VTPAEERASPKKGRFRDNKKCYRDMEEGGTAGNDTAQVKRGSQTG
jgi:hypothetical protein